MPWKETCPMDEKIKFIAACAEDVNFSALCRSFGISRKTGYKWVARYNQVGIDGLKERAPIAARIPHRTSQELVDAIVAVRKAHPFWGPRKLRKLLMEGDGEKAWPVASTMGELLKKFGLIRPRRRRIHVGLSGTPLGPCQCPNDVWCVDFKGHFRLGDGSRCYPLTISDAASRYLIRCEALEYCGEPFVREHFEAAFREFGLPVRMRSDNGPPFASLAPGGLSALSVWWIKLGILPERIEPGHPEQNGRHERMHRTLKMEATQPPEDNLQEQQRRFDLFRREYNELRPHEALGQDSPSKHYAPSPRAHPQKLLVPQYKDAVVRWVGDNGIVKWRRQAIAVGRPLADEPVGFVQKTDWCWEVFYGPIRLGYVDDRERTVTLHRRAVPPMDLDNPSEPAISLDRRRKPYVTHNVTLKRKKRCRRVSPKRPV